MNAFIVLGILAQIPNRAWRNFGVHGTHPKIRPDMGGAALLIEYGSDRRFVWVLTTTVSRMPRYPCMSRGLTVIPDGAL